MKSRSQPSCLISIIMPLYNEQESVLFVLNEIKLTITNFLSDFQFEIIFVDDCSTDNSVHLLIDEMNSLLPNMILKIIRLTKNCGSHVAISAGLTVAKGDLVIIMSSDGQDPSEIIVTLVREWELGNRLILASRKQNLEQGIISRNFSRLAWQIMNWSSNLKMPDGGCDLLAMDRRVVNAYNAQSERNTTFIFKVMALGYKFKEISYIKRQRHAGNSKWTFLAKMSIMIDAITGFSNRPLRLIVKIGLVVFFLLILRWASIIYKVYFLGETPTDLTIVLNTILVAFSMIILFLGVIGDYVWRILDETRKRSVFVIDEVIDSAASNEEQLNTK